MLAQSRWLTLAVVSIALLLVVVDMTVLYTALPSLALALHTTASEKLWILNAYSLVMAGLMPIMGALGDRLGHRPVFIYGMLLFAIASIVAAFAPNPSILIAARAALGIGGAAMLPTTIAIIRTTFQNPKELALAIGVWTSVASGGAAIGPLLGGVLLEHFWWGSVFLINVPIIGVATLLALLFVPTRQGDRSIRIDAHSCWQSLLGIISLAFAIKEFAQPNSNQLLALSTLLIGILTLIVFVRRQLSLEQPLINFRLLSRAPIATAIFVAFIASMVLIGFELVLSQRLQLVLGKSPLEAGAFVLPISLGSFFASLITGVLMSRLSCISIISAGLALGAAGIWGYLLLPDSLLWPQVSALAVCGIGIGASLTAASTLLMSNVSGDQAGMAGSVEGVAYEFGGGFGVTLFGSIMTAIYVAQMQKSKVGSMAGSSIDEAILYAQTHSDSASIVQSATQAFESAFSGVSSIVIVALFILSMVVLIAGRKI